MRLVNFWDDVACHHLSVSSASVVEVEAILISTVQDPEKDAVRELKDEEQGRIHDVEFLPLPPGWNDHMKNKRGKTPVFWCFRILGIGEMPHCF